MPDEYEDKRDLDFEESDQNSLSTKVGTVGWPADAENEQGVGPGANEPGASPESPSEPTPQPDQPQPQPQPQPQQPQPEQPSS